MADYLPTPIIKKQHGKYNLNQPNCSIGRLKQHFGQISVLIKAYAYIRTMSAKGLKQASEDAVLNANYIQHHLQDILPPVFNQSCMHECLLSGHLLPTSSFSFAKRLIDHNMHPPTLTGAGCVYYPEGLKNAMLIEPTETESQADLDNIISTFRKIYHESCADVTFINQAPHSKRVSKIPEAAQVLPNN